MSSASHSASTTGRRADAWCITTTTNANTTNTNDSTNTNNAGAGAGAGDTTTSYERLFGDSEAAFYPASQAGLGDMFLHIQFTAPKRCMRPERVRIGWAVVRRRHPMLMCRVGAGGAGAGAGAGGDGIPYFSFTPPTGISGALDEAGRALFFVESSKDEMIYGYMNGPRVLSDAALSRLVISSSSPSSPNENKDETTTQTTITTETETTTEENEKETATYDLLMCAPHFLGDGTSLHQATHDLLSLLASPLADAELMRELVVVGGGGEGEVEGEESVWINTLPPAFESRMNVPDGRFARAVSRVDFVRALGKEIGGHTLPRQQRAPQSTILHETSFSEEDTAKILKRCKENGVTVNHAVVVLCGVAWARTMGMGRGRGREGGKELPLMMYTAISLRPYLSSLPLPHQSPTGSPPTYWFIALTYFNIVLPAFLPATQAVLWHRARDVKTQIRKMVCSPFLKSRALEMGGIRAARARGQTVEMPSLSLFEDQADAAAGNRKWTPGPAPSKALLGLSLIGNLDGTYRRGEYPSFELKTVTTASRQKAGGMLLLEHTFGGRLWLHLCWDENGFEEGRVEAWWRELEGAVREFLV